MTSVFSLLSTVEVFPNYPRLYTGISLFAIASTGMANVMSKQRANGDAVSVCVTAEAAQNCAINAPDARLDNVCSGFIAKKPLSLLFCCPQGLVCREFTSVRRYCLAQSQLMLYRTTKHSHSFYACSAELRE